MIRLFLAGWMATSTFLMWGESVVAQESPHRGRPLWHSFDVRDTGAMPKTHAAAIDDRGLVYAANDAGLLSFDGSRWKIYPAGLAKAPLRVLMPLQNGSWLAGGGHHLGVFSPTPDGTLKWTDVEDGSAAEPSDEILTLMPGQSEIFVITDRAISSWKDGVLSQIYSGLPTGFAFIAGSNLVASIEGGLVIIDQNGNRELTPPPGWNEIEPISVLPGENDNPVLVTKRSGLFAISLVDGQLTLSPIWDILPAPLEPVRLSAGTRYQDGTFLLGAETGGIFHIDGMGNTLRIIDERSGFRGGIVRDIVAKPDGNTFVFHDGGMIWIDLDDEQRVWDKTNGLVSPVTAVAVDAATIYAGTNVGLFRSLSGGRMVRVEKPGMEPILTLNRFARSSMRGHASILLGREDGVFDFLNNELVEITTERPSVAFISRTQPSRLAIGTRNLIRLFEFDRGEWLDVGLLGKPNEADISDLTETNEGDLLVALADGSVVRYTADRWLGDGNMDAATPLTTQTFSRRINAEVHPQFASSGDKIHLFASGTALLWDYGTGQFSTDTALTTALAVIFGADQPRWFSSSRDKNALWIQTSQGTFLMPSDSQDLIRLRAVTAGTDQHSTLVIDTAHSRVLIGTPDGLLSSPISPQESTSTEGLPPLIIRGVSIDGDDHYGGEGFVSTIRLPPHAQKLTVKFAVVDWPARCSDLDYVAEVRKPQSEALLVPVNRNCSVILDTDLFRADQSKVEIRLTHDGVPTTESEVLHLQARKAWFTSATTPFVLAALLSIASLFGGLKPKPVWSASIRRHLALVASLMLCLAIAITAQLPLPPESWSILGSWIVGLALVGLALPLCTEALMWLGERRYFSDKA